MILAAKGRATERVRVAGLVNALAGVGTSNDKTASSSFRRPYFQRQELDTAYRSSWVLQKAVDILVDDCFHLPRILEGGSDAYAETVQATFRLDDRLRSALKAARLYGTALLVIDSRENALDAPLNAEQIQPGDISNLWVAGRYDCEPMGEITDTFLPDYGLPEAYRIRTVAGRYVNVHASRTVRFDGIRPVAPVNDYERGWGTSVLAPIMQAAIGEELAARAAGQNVIENSIFVLKTRGWNKSMSGLAPNSMADMGPLIKEASTQSMMKSTFNTLNLGMEDDASRVNAPLSGIDDVMEALAKRISAAVGVPYTRFMSQSPAGMNATGESDSKNYALFIGSKQRDWLESAYRQLDSLLARSLGLEMPTRFSFPSLFIESQEEKALAYSETLSYLNALVSSGVITDDGVNQYMRSVDPHLKALPVGERLTDTADMSLAQEEDE